jgi:hypothetical protein
MFTFGPAYRQNGLITDPYFANVIALLHFNGINGSTTFTDVKGNTWANGPPYGPPYDGSIISNVQSKFGGTSLLQDGRDIIPGPAGGSDFIFSDDFTVECWVYTQSTVGMTGLGNQYIYLVSGATDDLQLRQDATTIRLVYGNKTVAHTIGTSPVGRWMHIFGSRNGSTLYAGCDGASTSMALGTSQSACTSTLIGGAQGGTYYVQDLRLTKDICRYTTSYTIPTAAFPDL